MFDQYLYPSIPLTNLCSLLLRHSLRLLQVQISWSFGLSPQSEQIVEALPSTDNQMNEQVEQGLL